MTFTPGEFYHLYNRGTDKRSIYTNANDYERFLSLLYIANSTNPFHLQEWRKKNRGETSIFLEEREETLVDICAYVLMPNHFHLLVREKSDGGISRFMQKLTTGYTMYFNTAHERSGALFQGVFKATHASEDCYLKYLISYIHLNPIKLIEPTWRETGIKNRARAEKYLANFTYSSYQDYAHDKRPQSVILQRTALPDYFESPRDFEEHITAWLEYAKEV